MSEIEFLEQNLAAQLDMEAITYKKISNSTQIFTLKCF